jgi:hypothetical protein
MYADRTFALTKLDWKILPLKPGYSNLINIICGYLKKSLRNSITNPMRDRKLTKKETGTCSKITTWPQAITVAKRSIEDLAKI